MRHALGRALPRQPFPSRSWSFVCVPQSCQDPFFCRAVLSGHENSEWPHGATQGVMRAKSTAGLLGSAVAACFFFEAFSPNYRSGQVESACGRGFGQLRLGGSMTAQPPRLAREVRAAAARCRLLRMLRHRLGARHHLISRAGRECHLHGTSGSLCGNPKSMWPVD